MWGGICTNPIIFPLLKISFTPIKGDRGPLCILAIPVTVVQPGCVNGGQSKGAKWPRGGGCGRGFSPSHGREIFWKFLYENDISCTLNGIIRGLVMWSDIYQSPTPPSFETLFYSNQGGRGHGPLCPKLCQWRWCSQDLSTGAKTRSEATERGRVWEGVSPSHGREIFQNLCVKTAFLAH